MAHTQYASSKSCRLNSAMQDPPCACFYSQFQIKNFALLFALLAPSFKFSPVVVISLLFQSRKSALYFGLVSKPNWLDLPLFRPPTLQTSRDNATRIASSVAPSRASLTRSVASYSASVGTRRRHRYALPHSSSANRSTQKRACWPFRSPTSR